MTIGVGQAGEQHALCWLVGQGYAILEHNFRIKRGEIDIIAQQHRTIAFIEVKTRTQSYTAIADAVPFAKQQRIIAVARHFRAFHVHHTPGEYIYRFDIVYIELLPTTGAWHIRHITNAFVPKDDLI